MAEKPGQIIEDVIIEGMSSEGKGFAKLRGQYGMRRIHLNGGAQTIECSLLDPILNPFGNR